MTLDRDEMIFVVGKAKPLATIYHFHDRSLAGLRDVRHTWLAFLRNGKTVEVRQTEPDSLSWLGPTVDTFALPRDDARTFRKSVGDYLKPRIEQVVTGAVERQGKLYGTIYRQPARSRGSVRVFRHDDNSLVVLREDVDGAFDRMDGFRTLGQAMAEVRCYT